MTYWETASAAFVGAGAVVVILLLASFVLSLIDKARTKRQARADAAADGSDGEGGDSGNVEDVGVSLFEPDEQLDVDRIAAIERRQAAADAAAQRRGEATTPILPVAVRQEMSRVMLCEPPIVEGVTLFAYLKHHAPRPSGLAWDSEDMGALANVTEALYTDAQRDPLVRAKFTGYDMEELRRHFVRALVTLTSKGLDVATADALGRAHAHLNITEIEFDAVTGHLVHALQRYLQPQVFETVLAQLSPAVQALRVRIVAAARVSG